MPEPAKEIGRCRGFVGRIFGHRFEAAYDNKCGEGKIPDPTDVGMKVATVHGNLPAIIEATKSRESRYVHSVCRRCGKTISRGSQLLS